MRISDWSSDVCSSDRVTNAAWRTPGYAAAIAWTSASFQSDAGEALSSDALPPLLGSSRESTQPRYRCWLTPGNGSAASIASRVSIVITADSPRPRVTRTDERGVGKECGRKVKYRWWRVQK